MPGSTIVKPTAANRSLMRPAAPSTRLALVTMTEAPSVTYAIVVGAAGGDVVVAVVSSGIADVGATVINGASVVEDGGRVVVVIAPACAEQENPGGDGRNRQQRRAPASARHRQRRSGERAPCTCHVHETTSGGPESVSTQVARSYFCVDRDQQFIDVFVEHRIRVDFRAGSPSPTLVPTATSPCPIHHRRPHGHHVLDHRSSHWLPACSRSTLNAMPGAIRAGGTGARASSRRTRRTRR